MSQAQSGTRSNAPLGVQAAAAATTGGGGKPSGTSTASAGDKPSDGAPAGEKKKSGNKLYIVEGKVHEFDTFAQAEKFLNAEGAPTQYSVLRGKQMKSKQKVTLR